MKIRNIIVVVSALLTLGLVSGCGAFSANTRDDGSGRSTFNSSQQTGDIHEDPGREFPL